MSVMLHQVHINATPEKVYEAISTTAGLRSWWTADSVTESHVGGMAEFGFGKRKTLFRMRIEELTPPQCLVWLCLGDVDEWKGTRLTWEMTSEEGGTCLRFVHANWRSTDGWFATCNSTWGELMHRLKAYVEGKAPGPHFQG
ncbi:MAG: SRPBCC domain-containing protein [Gemmataceae bacterium]|nr:SRPBCC domain-containing protein [Gemmataceae bacterium]